MIRQDNEFERPLLPDRMQRRIEAVGVSVIAIHAQGAVTWPTQARPFEQALVRSRAFRAAVSPHLDSLRRYLGQRVEIWPGLSLVSLPTRQHRRSDSDADQPVLAALLPGPKLLSTPEFADVADETGQDQTAWIAQVDRTALLGDAEADRLAKLIVWMQIDGVETDRRCDELRNMSQELGEAYEELSLLYRLTTTMTVARPSSQFITEACRELQEVVGLRWIAFLLQDDEPRLQDVVGRIFTAGHIASDAIELKLIAANLMRRFKDASEPVVIENADTLDIPTLAGLARQLLVIPLVRDGRTFGIMFGGDKIDESAISSADSKLCHALANTLSIFLENTLLFEDMQAMFLGTLHALTTSIDAKDRYTRGHSDRVALMSRKLAEAAQLKPAQVERVFLAALIHDLGKIGVPEAVLAKPGRLTPEEFELIKLHPEIGARIIAAIRPMKDLVPGVLHHHERFDGGGYPYGLAGNTIPLMGRIICLADSFDAMSSDRSYRNPMPHNQVLTEIQRCAGTQFDPHLAELFVRLEFSEFFEMIQDQRDATETRARSA